MRVNIKNNEITSVEFLNTDEVIEFIQKFNKDRNKELDSIDFDKIADEIADKIIDKKVIDEGPFTSTSDRPIPVWYQNLSDPYTQRLNTPYTVDPNQFKIEDPVPYPYTITSATK